MRSPGAHSWGTVLFRDIYYLKYYGKGGGEEWSAEEKNKLGVMGKWKRGKKKVENYIKKGVKGPKYASFWAIN